MRVRLLVVILIAAVFGTSCSVWPEKKHLGWHQASGGEALERLMWESVRRKDWLSVETHISPTFTSVMNGRTLDKGGALEQLKTIELKSFTLSEVTVTPNGDTMTVAYVFAPEPGRPSRAMTVWQHQKSGWVAIAHAETPSNQ
jgi:hypothetical protein